MIHLLLFEHIQNAIQSLRSTRLRTLLTTLGVAIGVASITSILALSGGVTKIVANQVEALGGNIAVIRPGAKPKGINDFANPLTQQAYTTSTISEQDLQSIRQLKGVEAAAPLMIINGAVKATASDNRAVNSTILATTPELETIAQLPIRDGQFIDSVTNRDTAVIGSQLSIDLFGTDEPIGQTFTVRGQTFTIIGVMKHMYNPINFNTIDFDHAAIISLDSGKAFHQGTTQIQQIDVRATSTAALPSVIKSINQQLLTNHQNEKDFTVLSGKDIAQPTSQFFVALSTIMTVIAAISLVVGGIGIMNIMLVGVAERTREIGLRKSVGASNGNIIWQFMIEALIMSLIGGVLGYVGGYIVAFSVSTLLPFEPVITWLIAVIALGMSVVVGVIFGLYPAIRAARKDPIESLRQYH
ncbi:MAG: ABC transporter permease [Candidatus Saccharimonadales bacterium]